MPCDDFMNGIHTHTHVQSHIECTHGSPRCSPDQQKHLNKYLRFGWTWGSSSTSSSLVISSAWCVFTFGRTIFHTPNTLCISNGPRRCTSLSLSLCCLFVTSSQSTNIPFLFHKRFAFTINGSSLLCGAAFEERRRRRWRRKQQQIRCCIDDVLCGIYFISFILPLLCSHFVLFNFRDRPTQSHSLAHTRSGTVQWIGPECKYEMQSLLNANSFVILLHIWSISPVVCERVSECTCVRCCCAQLSIQNVRIYLEHFTVRTTSKFEQIMEAKNARECKWTCRENIIIQFQYEVDVRCENSATCDSETRTPHLHTGWMFHCAVCKIHRIYYNCEHTHFVCMCVCVNRLHYEIAN